MTPNEELHDALRSAYARGGLSPEEARQCAEAFLADPVALGRLGDALFRLRRSEREEAVGDLLAEKAGRQGPLASRRS